MVRHCVIDKYVIIRKHLSREDNKCVFSADTNQRSHQLPPTATARSCFEDPSRVTNYVSCKRRDKSDSVPL